MSNDLEPLAGAGRCWTGATPGVMPSERCNSPTHRLPSRDFQREPAIAGTTRRLEEFAAGIDFASLDPDVVESTRMLLLDQVGISIRGRNDAGLSASMAAALRHLGLGSGNASVIGDGAAYSPPAAALFNGNVGHSLNFDDTHASGSIHPSAPIVPAARGGPASRRSSRPAVGGDRRRRHELPPPAQDRHRTRRPPPGRDPGRRARPRFGTGPSCVTRAISLDTDVLVIGGGLRARGRLGTPIAPGCRHHGDQGMAGSNVPGARPAGSTA